MEQALYIIRHAHASHSENDGERPLSDKGLKQMDRLCSALRGKGLIRASQIWHSHLKRAVETAQALKEGLELEATLIERDGLAPFDDPAEIANDIQSSQESLVIAGHEPNGLHPSFRSQLFRANRFPEGVDPLLVPPQGRLSSHALANRVAYQPSPLQIREQPL